MTLGSTPRQADIFRSTTEFCEPRVRPDSIYALLHRECFALFPDALFGDLFTDIGRRSFPSKPSYDRVRSWVRAVAPLRSSSAVRVS
jgi:hypothetical protein